jgi:aminoglycoside 6-adenylyltransferase
VEDATTAQRVAEWAEAHEDVRVVLLVGSRAESDGRPDPLSDYDVLLFVQDAESYEADESWLSAFGSILVKLDEQYEMLETRIATRLVQYQDGSRIDFSICGLGLLERIAQERRLPDDLDHGFRVLVDKDDWSSRFPSWTGGALQERVPSEAEYQDVVNEFWWEVLYVAKYLARGEILPALYSHECVIRFRCVVPMLEWYTRVVNGSERRIGPHGRRLRGELGEEEWDRLGRTLLKWSEEEGWKALFETTEYFEATSKTVADHLGFSAQDDLAEGVGALLRRMRDGQPGAGTTEQRPYNT